ncbi:radical SAM protein [termite gut metagenome]|uniref:Radical SAM protein n=1 Tax=termite gut metagenome TaxID=433724 RepID=A0A5J4S1M0_9ZZZZ
MTTQELNIYMNQSIERLIKNTLKATFANPQATTFVLKMQKVIVEAQKKRENYEISGTHIPAFLISSITDNCNLFCSGCYARSNGICGTGKSTGERLSVMQWKRIFTDAVEMGISFNLLAGGEPLLRKDVILAAADVKNMIFPVFTNGTLVQGEYFDIFVNNRNLIPVLSLEGEQNETDKRRGDGVYDKIIAVMKQLNAKKLFFGTSVTVTTENRQTVTSTSFLEMLQKSGCKLVIYVEYVPMEKDTAYLALTNKDCEELDQDIDTLRKQYESTIFLSFPGDEKYMGGCLAAGRGFFHINPGGNAEACPFSPYSDRNLTQVSLLEAIQSPFFERLRSSGLVGGEHTGGCTLFEKEDDVKKLLL